MNKTKRICTFLLACVATLTLLAGCGNTASSAGAPASQPVSASLPQSTPAENGGIAFTDMMGRDITLEAPATKVVALTAADCEIVYALGGGSAMVGRGEYCDYPAEVLDLPAVDSGNETNVEQIIALEPQVVFMSSMNQGVEQVQQLEDAGIAVVVNEAQSIDGVYTAIGVIGAALGKDDEAAALVQEMQQEFDTLANSVPEADAGQSAYLEISPLEWGLWTAGANTFMDEIADMLNLENVFHDVEGWAEISQEQVLERDPAIIVTTMMYMGEGPTPTEEIAGRDGWQNVAAVANARLFEANNDELTRPGPRLVDGAKALYAFVYGELAQRAA